MNKYDISVTVMEFDETRINDIKLALNDMIDFGPGRGAIFEPDGWTISGRGIAESKKNRDEMARMVRDHMHEANGAPCRVDLNMKCLSEAPEVSYNFEAKPVLRITYSVDGWWIVWRRADRAQKVAEHCRHKRLVDAIAEANNNDVVCDVEGVSPEQLNQIIESQADQPCVRRAGDSIVVGDKKTVKVSFTEREVEELDVLPQINWSAFGWSSIEEAEEYAKLILSACEVARTIK